jgi:alpha-beta hydrolase superfamily lysophospholipase
MEPVDHSFTAEDGTLLRAHVIRAQAARGWVLVVHGLDDHLDRFGELARFLHESGYDVVLYDQRGHGGSGGVRNHVASFSDYVGDLERVRRLALPEGAGAPHLFGHSMGSVIALLAAIRDPGRWRSVIVQGFPALPGRNIPKLAGALLRAVRPLVARVRTPTGLDAEALSHDEAVAEAYRRDPWVKGDVTLGWTVEFLDALAALREGAASITSPLLILHGGQDTIALPEGARWLAEHAGASDRKLVIYPELKHELHNELAKDRARVFADIRAWLEGH